MKRVTQSYLLSQTSDRNWASGQQNPRFYSMGWQLWTGLTKFARLIRYANYLVLTKTDLDVHSYNEPREKTVDYIFRPSANLKRSKEMVLKSNSTATRWEKVLLNYHYRSYGYLHISFSRKLKARATILSLTFNLKILGWIFRQKLLSVNKFWSNNIEW